MKKWFSSRESKKITAIISILCTVLAIQIMGFLEFNKKLYYMSLDHSMEQVEELSVYVERNFQLELERYIHILQVIEKQIEQEEVMFSDEMLGQLQKVHEVSNFKKMGISDLDGKGVDSSGKRYDISYEYMQEHIRHDEVYISNVLKSDNETQIFIGVPLKIKGEISGILWGKYALNDMMCNIELVNDTYKYFQIIDDKGNYLLSSNKQSALNRDSQVLEQTIWRELEGYNYRDEVSVQEIYHKVQQGESGNFYFESNGQGRYVSYRPLEINNWYLFSVQAEDEMHSYVYHTREIAIHLLIVITVGLLTIFAVIYNLIYTMYIKMTKQNRKIQAINTMLQATLQQTRNIPFTIDHKLKQVVLYGYPNKDVTQYCSFADMEPDTMVKKGLVDADSLEEYKKLYQSLLVEKKKCDPVIIYSRIAGKKGWVRISIISDIKENTEEMIGVLEDYGEHKEKDLKIDSQLQNIKKIKRKSQIDFLTRLYNREAFLEKIQIALDENNRNQQTGALLILDLDHFKEVNDCLGHGMGDTVLRETADTLYSFFRKEDIVGRLGGDEFVIFAHNIQNISSFEQRIQELNHLLCKSYTKDGKCVAVSASIGIMLTDEEHLTFDALYEKADQALYQVKQGGRNGYRMYSHRGKGL